MNRDEMIKKRLSMPEEEVLERSYLAQERLLSLECFKMAKRIMIYMPIQNEVSTERILIRSVAQRFFAPRIVRDGEMEAVELLGSTVRGTFGIEEPTGKAYCGDIDLFVVPGLFFSEKGARVGRGKGYYDNFLKGRKGIKAGLCYSFQIDNTISTKETDVPMDFVVTDKGVF